MTSEAFVTMRVDGSDVIRHHNVTMAEAVQSRTRLAHESASPQKARVLVTFGSAESVWRINEDGTLGLTTNMVRATRDNYIKIAKEAL